jgi:phage tail sheath gpL-like
VTLPLAANPTSPTPGFWLVVNLEPSTVAPGSQGLRALILGPSNTTGDDITENTEIRPLYEQSDAEDAAGIGSLPSLAYQAIIARDKAAQVDLACPAKSAGNAAAGAFELSGTVAAGTACCFVSGVEVQVPIYAGEALTDWRDRAVDLINRHASEIHYTASAGSAGAVTMTAKSTGPAGNDGKFRVKLLEASGMTLAATQPTGGTTEPDYATVLALVAGREYDYILPCGSNADVISTTGVLADLSDHINGLNTGLGAKLQQGIAGCTGTIANSKTATAALNDQTMEFKTAVSAEAMPCQIAGDELGDRMALRRIYSSRNRIGNLVEVPGSADPVGDNPVAPTETDDALSHGVSLVGYKDSGQPYTIRAVTTYQETAGGSAVLCTDCNEIDAMYDVAKDLRAFLPQEYANCKVVESPATATDTPQDQLPEGVVETRVIRGSIISRIENFWVPKGSINGDHFAEVVADGSLAVHVNDTDETQVDIYIPLKPFKNLAKFGVYMKKAG